MPFKALIPWKSPFGKIFSDCILPCRKAAPETRFCQMIPTSKRRLIGRAECDVFIIFTRSPRRLPRRSAMPKRQSRSAQGSRTHRSFCNQNRVEYAAKRSVGRAVFHNKFAAGVLYHRGRSAAVKIHGICCAELLQHERQIEQRCAV